MSYRAAWGKIKKTENVLGAPLIIRCGHRRQGHALTPLGRQILDFFMRWFQEVEQFALQRARQTFPWPIHGFPAKPPLSI